MALTVQNGSLVVRDGALGTGQGCCCNKCSGPCDSENPCPEGCVCVDGQCVAGAGACCYRETINCGVCFYEWNGSGYDEGLFESPGFDCAVCPACPPVADIAGVLPATPPPSGVFMLDMFCQDVGELVCEDTLSQAECNAKSGTFHPGKACVEEPCSDGCFEQALLGDEAYVDGWCANAASSVGFAGSPCELTTATCGARTLVNEYSPGFGDWIVTVCCDNPLP